MTATPPNLAPLTFDQQVGVEAYKEAIKQALSAAGDASGTVLTACFSIATAYGALISLVAPKNEQNPFVLALPFVFFGLAAVAAMVGKVAGVTTGSVTTTEQVNNRITAAVSTKRRAAWISICLIAVGLVVAGLVTAASYGSKAHADDDGKTTSITLNDSGKVVLATICGMPADKIKGSVKASPVSTALAAIELADPATCANQGEIVLPITGIVGYAVGE